MEIHRIEWCALPKLWEGSGIGISKFWYTMHVILSCLSEHLYIYSNPLSTYLLPWLLWSPYLLTQALPTNPWATNFPQREVYHTMPPVASVRSLILWIHTDIWPLNKPENWWLQPNISLTDHTNQKAIFVDKHWALTTLVTQKFVTVQLSTNPVLVQPSTKPVVVISLPEPKQGRPII